MNELLLAATARKSATLLPVVGYNFSDDKSTGLNAIAHQVVSGSPTALADSAQFGPYKRAWNGYSAAAVFTPQSAFPKILTGDFTVSIVMKFTGAKYPVTFFKASYASNPGINLYIPSSYGNRLSFYMNGSQISTIYATNLTITSIAGAWFTLTIQRKDGVIRAYYNGNEIGLSLVNSSTYTMGTIVDRTSLTGINTFTVTETGNYAMVADFAVYDQAIYEPGNHEATYPLVA